MSRRIRLCEEASLSECASRCYSDGLDGFSRRQSGAALMGSSVSQRHLMIAPTGLTQFARSSVRFTGHRIVYG